MTTTAAWREFYADEIRAVAHLRSASLVRALAEVPREAFLGPGPWKIAAMDARRPGAVVYRATPDADPRHLSHNVLVAIDAAREINNGQPSMVTGCLDQLGLAAGDTFVHIGCGVGYYTALAAAVVGPRGRVVAIEIDPDLAARAQRNLASDANVDVIAGDGASAPLPRSSAILVNAGFTHPLGTWLDALEDGGRLLVPITAAIPGSAAGGGSLCLITRKGDRYGAHPAGPIAIFSSPTGRDDAQNAAVREAFASGRWYQMQSLRRDAHEKIATCCLHHADACFSSEPVVQRPSGRR
jgi:protein-L-isoaspartate(D-aspartate) O-methyltransferase